MWKVKLILTSKHNTALIFLTYFDFKRSNYLKRLAPLNSVINAVITLQLLLILFCAGTFTIDDTPQWGPVRGDVTTYLELLILRHELRFYLILDKLLFQNIFLSYVTLLLFVIYSLFLLCLFSLVCHAMFFYITSATNTYKKKTIFNFCKV